jgi:hypothetical protein
MIEGVPIPGAFAEVHARRDLTGRLRFVTARRSPGVVR